MSTVGRHEQPENNSRVRFHLDPHRQAFLDDHRVGGTPLLSTVMGMEAMASAASSLRPDLVAWRMDGLEVHPPVLLHGDLPLDVDVVVSEVADDSARCRLVTHQEAEEIVHYRATLRWGSADPEPPAVRHVPSQREGDPAVGAEEIYRLYFHGPSFRVVEQAFYSPGSDSMVATLTPRLPPIATPAGPTTLSPLLVELCLQTAGLWELARAGTMMVPAGVERITRFRATEVYDDVDLRAVVSRRIAKGRDCYDAEVIDGGGRLHLRVDGYRTTELPVPFDASAAEPILSALRT